MFPVVLNLAGRLAVVVGGGPVGLRRAAALRAGGARVRVVCLEPCPEGLPREGLDWRQEPYTPAHLEGAALVLAAGPAGLNARVVADARGRGLWVNSASDPDGGDFHVPATVRRGALLLAVSTGGAAPALAGAVRRRLEKEYDETFATWAALLAELRPAVQARLSDPARRRGLLEELCRDEWLARLRQEGEEAVRRAMREALEQAADSGGPSLGHPGGMP